VSDAAAWSEWVALADLRGGAAKRLIAADHDARVRIAARLGLDGLDRLEAEVRVAPWLDGATVEARWSASIEQTCGVTLERFGSELEGAFQVRALPRGSPNAPEDNGPEIAVDPESDDPPDLIEDDRIDVAAYVVEHLALEIDPFPRKPGAAFEPPEEERPASPFAVLRDLKPRSD
jgi:hypothetical protein